MAFKLRTIDMPATLPAETLGATAGEAYAAGEALKLAAGRVTKAGATDKPVYICAGTLPAGAAGEPVPCFRVNALQVWDAELSAAGTALKIGDKVTLADDGLRLTATTTSGVAEIVAIDGTAAGEHVAVRF